MKIPEFWKNSNVSNSSNGSNGSVPRRSNLSTLVDPRVHAICADERGAVILAGNEAIRLHIGRAGLVSAGIGALVLAGVSWGHVCKGARVRECMSAIFILIFTACFLDVFQSNPLYELSISVSILRRLLHFSLSWFSLIFTYFHCMHLDVFQSTPLMSSVSR